MKSKWKSRSNHEIAAGALVAVAALVSVVQAGSLDLSWYSIDGGGAMFCTGGNLELSGTIGQPDAGPGATGMSGGNLELVGGFWAGAASLPPSSPCPDFDGDGDVDSGDFAVFAQCFGGSFNPPAPSCPGGVDADLDLDGDVDPGDFAVFSQCFGGNNNPPAATCPLKCS